MVFWILAFLLTVAASALVTRPLWAKRETAPPRAAYDAQVFKSQLREIERDFERGAVTAEDAEGARREIGRKLLATVDEAQSDDGAAPASLQTARLGVAASALLLALGGVAVYAGIGSPGAPDRPLAQRNFLAEQLENRLSQEQAEELAAEAAAERPSTPIPEPEGLPEGTDFATLIQRMETVLKERPEDTQGRLILARAYLRVDRAADAWRLLAEAREILGADAPPDLAVDQGEAMVIAGGGYVSRDAELVLREVPNAPRSRYFINLAQAQSGNLGDAVAGWAQLLQDYPDAPFAPLLRDQIRRAGQEAGIDVAGFLGEGPALGPRISAVPEAGETAPGPSQEEIEAAAELSEEERAAMIDTMVTRLADRLDDDPRDVVGWMRLIRAYGVLGRMDEAQAAYERAKGVFEDDTPNLRNLAEAAALAGLDP
ncbi:MAG: c-type cytochrome biogenesis protein CcmI [Pseudomonadota bacterium]